jgi:protoporphyrinogen oxidase
VWGVDPASIAAEWAPRRIMVGGLTSLLRALLIAEHRRPPTTTRQYYYPRLGAGQLYEGMARRCVDAGATFLYGHRAEAVQVDPGRITVRAVSGQATRDLELDALISTAPLPDLISALRPAPPREICQAAQALRYRGIIFVFVRLNRGIALGWDALYVPEPQYTFFRVEEPRLWSTGLVPPGKSSLCFEIAASPGDAAWSATDEELVATCLADFARIGFVIPAREVEGFDVARRAHVYPMHLVGTGEARERCLEWLAGLGPRLQSVGRQGAFRYLDMDESLEMGWRAAGVVNGDDPVPQMAQENRYLWDPKRQLAGS